MGFQKNIDAGLVGLWLTSLFIFQSCSPDRSQAPQIIIAEDFGTISLQGISPTSKEELSQQLQLFISHENGQIRKDQSPVTGSYRLDNTIASFTPSYPLLQGKSYLVRYDNGDTLLEQQIHIPDYNGASISQVAQVYPSASVLPLNVLKFYIQFTDSMARGFAYDNIHFINAQGDTLEEVYLDLEEELWSPDMKRFTLLLDPGRIKRGLQSLQDLGYVFEQRGEYRLVVNKQWPDAHDQPMKGHFTQKFSTLDFAERHPADFQISKIPPANSLEALTMTSSEPNDYALLQRVVHVVNHKGDILKGSITLAEEERKWLFTPESSWKPGSYRIRIETILEDLAGNNLVNAFDVDNAKDKTVLNAEKYMNLPFTIKE